MPLVFASEGRLILRGRQIVLGLLVIFGILLLCYSLYIGTMIGADWYGKDATFQWHLNNYIVMDAQYAYTFFGLGALAIGGLATGIAMASFFTFNRTKKHILILVAAFFAAIGLSGLGFNTLDFMLGCFYWTNMAYPPPVQVAIIGAVDVWNFYFFLFVVPMWLSGFLIGSVTSYATFIHPKHKSFSYAKNSKLAVTFKNREYVTESALYSRNRGVNKQQPFEYLN